MTPRKERHQCLQSFLCKTVLPFYGMFKSCSLKLNILLGNIPLKYFSKFQRSTRGNQRQRPPGLRQADAADHREGFQVDRGREQQIFDFVKLTGTS